MLDPDYDVRPIALRGRKPNPWFKRGTVFRCCITDAPPRRHLFGAVQSWLRNHKGTAVVEDMSAHPARRALREVP